MKAIRVRTWDKEIRLCTLGAHPHAASFWFEAKACGHIVGEKWCMPFENAALIDVVEIPDELGQQNIEQGAQQSRGLDALTGAIAAGVWKPPHE